MEERGKTRPMPKKRAENVRKERKESFDEPKKQSPRVSGDVSSRSAKDKYGRKS